MSRLTEVAKTGLNTLAIQAMISKYIAQASANVISNKSDDILRRKNALQITSKNSAGVLNLLGVDISTNVPRPDLFDRNYFMVCNHMSYVDILVLSSCQPAVFVTSVEMEKTFFLGDMAKLGGSFFVNRVNRRKMKEEVEKLKSLVTSGFNVFIFPEGTSTNGLNGVLPFKKSLFRVPFQADIPILPICLKYESINNQPFSQKNCDRVCWYDDMTFAPHLLQLMGLREMKVSIEYMEPLNPKDFVDHGQLAQEAHRLVSDSYGQPEKW